MRPALVASRSFPDRTIAEVAKLTGLTPRAIRYYEQRGLIDVGRDCGGKRRFGDIAFVRLRMIWQLRRVGLSLAEISAILASGEEPNSRARQAALALERLSIRLSSHRRAADEIVALIDQVRRGGLG